MHVSWNDYGLQWRMLSLCKYVFPFNTKCNFVPVKWSLNSYVFLLSLERFIKLYRLSGYVGCFDNKWLFSSKQLLGKCFKMVFFFVAKGYTFWERAQTLSIVWLFATLWFLCPWDYTLSRYHIFSLSPWKEETTKQRNDKPCPTYIIYSQPILSLKVRRQGDYYLGNLYLERVALLDQSANNLN